MENVRITGETHGLRVPLRPLFAPDVLVENRCGWHLGADPGDPIASSLIEPTRKTA